MSKQQGCLGALGHIISRFNNDRSGTAAVEFVLVAPLIILVYLGAVEVSEVIEADKNVSRTAGIIADIVAQQSDVSSAQMDDIFEIGAATIFPYDRDKAGIKVTAIQVASTPLTNPPATVAWSYANGKLSPDTKKSTIDIPTSFQTNGTFLIRVEISLTYEPITTWGMRNIGSMNDGFPLSEIYYFAPRLSQTITCSNC